MLKSQWCKTVMDEYTLCVSADKTDQRLDTFLTESFEQWTRSHIQNLIKNGNITVNGQHIKSGYKLRDGDIIKVDVPELRPINVQPEDIPLNILYEDEDIIVINKPQGMVVHPAAGNYSGTLVNALLAHCKDLSGINGEIRPGIVHRIDKDTSGVLVVAKNDMAHVALAQQIKEKTAIRKYVALLEGDIKEDTGVINAPIARHPTDRKKMAVVSGGRSAITHFKVLERFGRYTLIEARLETGRTHQIRVHMAYIGHPVVGDPIYGYRRQAFALKGQLLHAQCLGFVHPRTGRYMEFCAPLPDYFVDIIEKLRQMQ